MGSQEREKKITRQEIKIMKVEDLIKSLQKYNPKADIGISMDGYYESELN